jgi:peptidoglycan-associated lipoprotein
MNLKKWIKVILVSSSIITLAACSSAHKNQDQSAVNEANAAYSSNDGAQASGLGDESGFGDQANGNGREKLLAKRVYYFDFDSNVVHDEDKPAIIANANYLAAHPKAKILLEGHTDPRGSREYNIGLGERRAKSVAELLTSKGVNPSQIRVVSYGAEKLAALGHDESAYQLDRRAVLVILKR